jgi:hypothetical protein
MSNPSTPSSDNNFEDVCVIPSVCKACGCVFCCDIYSKIVPTLVVLGRKVIVSFMYLINDIINKYQRSIALKNVIHSISLIVDGEKFISLLFNILFSPISSSLVPESLKPGTSDDVEYSSLSSLKQTKPKKERKTMREKEIEADLGKSGIIPKIVTIFSLSSAYLLPSLNSNSFLPKYPPLNLESTDLYGQSKVLPFIPVEFITSLLWLPSTQAIFSHCEIYALPTVTNLFMDITQTVYKQIHEEPQENCKGEFEIQVDSTEKSDITNQLLLLSFDTHTRGFASLKALLTLITIFVSSSLERHVSSPSQSTQPSVNKAPSSLSSAFDAPPAVAGEIKTPLTGEVFFSFVPQNPVSPQQALLQFSITASSTPKPLPFSLVSFLCSLLASLKSFIVLVNLLTVRDLKRNFQTQDSSEDEKKFDRSVSLVPTILNGLSLLYETVSSGMINPTKGFVATSTATSSYKFNPMLSIGTSLNDYICSSGMLFSLVESLSALFVTNLFVNEVNKASGLEIL